jgi:hypothetical protein
MDVGLAQTAAPGHTGRDAAVPAPRSLNVAVLGSGKGSHWQAITDTSREGRPNARIVPVLSNVDNAYVLERVRKNGVPLRFITGAPLGDNRCLCR